VNSKASSVAGLSVAGTATGSGSKMQAGAFHYAMTFVNDFGESAPIFTSAAVTVTAGQRVTLAVTGSIPADVKFMKIYRSANGAAAQSAQFVTNHRIGAAVVDAGEKRPGLGEIFLLDLKPESMKFKQLLPLSSMSLAVVSTALEFLIIMYGSLFCFAPRFQGVLRNAGK
jgi:hypothetical protein